MVTVELIIDGIVKFLKDQTNVEKAVLPQNLCDKN